MIDVKLIILMLISKNKTRITKGGKERAIHCKDKDKYHENIDSSKIIILVSCPN